MKNATSQRFSFLAIMLASVLAACSTTPPQGAAAGAAPKAADFPKAGLQLWLSAATIEQTDGSITLLKDLSGNANHAKRSGTAAGATAGTANPTLIKDGASGQPLLHFSGANVAFEFKRISDIRTAFWVVSKDPASFGQKSEKFVLGDTVSNDFHAGWTDDTIFNTDVNPGHLAQALHDGKTWLNGQSVVADKTPFPRQLCVISILSTGPVKANQIARDRNMTSRAWQGDIAEILLYNVALSDADRQSVENYLTAKYAFKPVVEVGMTVPPAAKAAQ